MMKPAARSEECDGGGDLARLGEAAEGNGSEDAFLLVVAERVDHIGLDGPWSHDVDGDVLRDANSLASERPRPTRPALEAA